MKKSLPPCRVEATEERVQFSIAPDPLDWRGAPDSGYIDCENAEDAQKAIALLAMPSPSKQAH